MKSHFASIFTNKHQKLIDEESDSFSFPALQLHDIQIDADKSKQQHSINIENTEVFFPHQPYDVQIQYMKSVILALDKKQNALLESPTGTGKTLSLLCATLGWLRKYRKQQNSTEAPKNLKIIYASRTHAQLKQVAHELKKTAYQPNISMLGSRDQYCIRGDFSQLKGNILNQSCRKAVKSNQCQFYKKDQLIMMASSYTTLLNSLEEAKQFGYKNKCCPYYFERQRLEYADLILLPYNYLLEKDFSEVVKIENSILIFDEAHNVQNTSQDGASFFITQNFIIEAEKDLERWVDEIESVGVLYDSLKVKLTTAKINPELREYRAIMITIRAFAQYLEQMKNSPEFRLQETEEKYQVFEAKEILTMIFAYTADNDNTFRLWTDSTLTNYAKGINRNNMSRYLAHCVALKEVMGELSQTQGHHFESWTKFIMNVYDLMVAEEERTSKKLSQDSLQNPINQYKLAFILDQANQLTLHMWCLDPSLSFARLLQKEIFSIILTSGTLAPFDSWTCELRLPFPIKLQNKHIIDINSNLRVFQNKTLDFSYNQRNNEEQINNLGVNLLNLCRVIPNGILVIFSSYSLMNKFRSKWQYSKLLIRLQEVKSCLWEPPQSTEMNNTFELYRQKITKGAIMFAVQRGKVAEGIDFSDELCRAVFLIGVPYPPKNDTRLVQKMNYLDKLFKDPEFNHEQRLKSSEWYTQQAIRATNQALGRVIRHINDYGIVFLCDKRFDYGDIRKGLSEWVKPAVQPWINDDEIIKKSKEFFNRDLIEQQCNQIVQPIQEEISQQEIKKRKPQFFGLPCSKELQKLQEDTHRRELEQLRQKQPEEFRIIEDSNHSFQVQTSQPQGKVPLKINIKQKEQGMKDSNQSHQQDEQSNKPEKFDFFSAQQQIFTTNQGQTESKKKGLCIKLKNNKK